MRLTFQVQRQNINSKHNNLHSILENNKSVGKEKKMEGKKGDEEFKGQNVKSYHY